MKHFYPFVFILLSFAMTVRGANIDRKALVNRNNPHVTEFDSLASLSVGNGEFAYTADITGLQTFPSRYSKGVPLGTQSQWCWHSFANPKNYQFEETLKKYNFRGKDELYSVQFKEEGRQQDAAEWFRVNQHRLHLGIIGFDLNETTDLNKISHVDQKLDMWTGKINSKFTLNNSEIEVETSCHPTMDMMAAHIAGNHIPGICFRFPYPTGQHSDDACNWTSNDKHSTSIESQNSNSVTLKRTLDATVYYVTISWTGKAKFSLKQSNYYVLQPLCNDFSFSTHFTENKNKDQNPDAKQTFAAAAAYWDRFWSQGGVVDFSACTDSRAKELERRVVLSQYLLAIQCSGSLPPQETGLTYNSWYGKFHLEMNWWHQSHFALWGHPELLERSLGWFYKALPKARDIARRQGFDGARWMKMTDPTGYESPSKVGSFLIWQQPHIIYLAELLYRSKQDKKVLEKYAKLVDETARFMYSFASYDQLEGRFILKGAIPAQETLRAADTENPPFELSYWHYAMSVAQKWRERMGQKRNLLWDEMIDKLSPLAYQDSLYLAAETATDTYKDIRFTSDHMAVLGALGVLPQCQLVRRDYMQNTLNWVWKNWNWGKTWGWDFAMTAMNAARLGDTEKAVGALLMDKRTNTYLPNGHNYQDSRLRVYLPGNGGLLTSIALMCAGWDGSTGNNPGFPKDGKWDVHWEGLLPMP